MKLNPLQRDILFIFVDEMENGKFVEKYGSIYLGTSTESTAKNARWGKIVALGPKVSNDVSVGMKVLIEPLAWTKGLEYDGVKVWRTIEEKILATEE